MAAGGAPGDPTNPDRGDRVNRNVQPGSRKRRYDLPRGNGAGNDRPKQAV